MAKRKKSSQHGRSGDPRRRAAEHGTHDQHRVDVQHEIDGEDRVDGQRTAAEATPELVHEVAAALAAGHPFDLAMLASAMIAGLDPDESAAGEDAAELPPPAEFVRMFLNSDDSRLQTLAWTVAQLLPDAQLQSEVSAAIGPGAIPDWLVGLAQPEVVAGWQTTDPLRDSSDVAISLRIGEQDLTVVGLVDLNSDGALKDGFGVPAPLSAFQEALAASGDTGMVAQVLTPADARGWLTEAIAVGRKMPLPYTSDSWPQARPLLEWAARQCPAGGLGWQRPNRTSKQIEEDIELIATEFAASPVGAVLRDRTDLAVLQEALVGIAEETGADPLLLSGVRLELGLGFLWLTTLHHDLDRLVALLDTLRTYVQWAHAQRGVPADDTDAALAVIAHRGAEFIRDVAELLDDDDDSDADD